MSLKKQVTRKKWIFLTVYILFMAAILGLIAVLGWQEISELIQVFTLLVPLVLLPLVLVVILSACGMYTGSFDRYWKTLDAAGKERFEREIQDGYRMKSAILTGDCIILINFMRLDVMPYRELVWLYKQRQFVYFMQMRQLTFITTDKKTHAMNLGREYDSMASEELIRRITEQQPNVLVGFDDDKAKLFRKDFERMKLMARPPVRQ